jgi:hypothetical protein
VHITKDAKSPSDRRFPRTSHGFPITNDEGRELFPHAIMETPEESDIETRENSPSRNLLLRGPNGYTVIIPLNNINASFDGNNIVIALPRTQANQLIEDISEARMGRRIPPRGRISRYDRDDESYISEENTGGEES